MYFRKDYMGLCHVASVLGGKGISDIPGPNRGSYEHHMALEYWALLFWVGVFKTLLPPNINFS